MISHARTNQLLLQRRQLDRLPTIGLAVYHPLTAIVDTIPTGQSVTRIGAGNNAVDEVTHQGIQCLRFLEMPNKLSMFQIPYSRQISTLGFNVTLSCWVAAQYPEGSNIKFAIVANGGYNDNNTNFVGINKGGNGISCVLRRSSSSQTLEAVITDTNFHHVAMVFTTPAPQTSAATWQCQIYLDGVYKSTISRASMPNAAFTNILLGVYSGDSNPGYVYEAAFRLYERQLSATEIALLAHEFTPQVTT